MILVVEDNPDMLAFIRKQLTTEYSVLTAMNGIEALAVLWIEGESRRRLTAQGAEAQWIGM